MKEKNNSHHEAVEAEAALLFESSADLSDRERLFVAHYLYTLDGSDAAAAAGYTGNRHVLRSTAYKVLHRPNVRSVIDDYLLSTFMSVAEMKSRLSAFARGSMADFLEINAETGVVGINLLRARERGVLGLIKKLRSKEVISKSGERVISIDLELYDSQAALVHIGKLYGLMTDSIRDEISDEDSPFEIMARAYRSGFQDKAE